MGCVLWEWYQLGPLPVRRVERSEPSDPFSQIGL